MTRGSQRDVYIFQFQRKSQFCGSISTTAISDSQSVFLFLSVREANFSGFLPLGTVSLGSGCELDSDLARTLQTEFTEFSAIYPARKALDLGRWKRGYNSRSCFLEFIFVLVVYPRFLICGNSIFKGPLI